MGAWGYGPLDNDGAADWLHSKLKKPIEQGLKSKDPTIAFAALGAVDKLNLVVSKVLLKKAIETVSASDSSAWSSPSARTGAVRRVAKRVLG
jgi:hypothetical protein